MSEPLSSPNSPLTGKLTGNFAKFAHEFLGEDLSITLNLDGFWLQSSIHLTKLTGNF